tara:strand:- start:530 stop:751 length:222 start_codon:yes stop_codon:yes gene_type:complete
VGERKGPNLQNIPIRTPEGAWIRDLFRQKFSPLFRNGEYEKLEKKLMEAHAKSGCTWENCYACEILMKVAEDG